MGGTPPSGGRPLRGHWGRVYTASSVVGRRPSANASIGMQRDDKTRLVSKQQTLRTRRNWKSRASLDPRVVALQLTDSAAGMAAILRVAEVAGAQRGLGSFLKPRSNVPLTDHFCLLPQ